MKKILCLLFAMLLIIGVAACSDEDGSKSSADEHDIIENKTYAGPATFSGSPEKMLILGISEKPMVGFVLTNDIAEVENYVFRGSETDEKKFVYAAKLPEDKSETAATANGIFPESCEIRPYDMSGNVIVYIQKGVMNRSDKTDGMRREYAEAIARRTSDMPFSLIYDIGNGYLLVISFRNIDITDEEFAATADRIYSLIKALPDEE